MVQFARLLKRRVACQAAAVKNWALAADRRQRRRGRSQGIAIAEHLSHMPMAVLGWRKLTQRPAGHPGRHLPRSKCDFGMCPGVSFWSNRWAVRRSLPHKIHFLWHIALRSRNGSHLLHKIRHFKNHFFPHFSVSSRGTHLSCFPLPICFKHQTTVEWSTLSSTSRELVRGQLGGLLSAGCC